MALKQDTSRSGLTFSRNDLLRWLYLGRLAVVTGILVGAFLTWFRGATDPQKFVATVMFVAALVTSGGGFWYTHLMQREPGENFLYTQVALDVFLVTGIIHITGGPESSFAPLYVLVIASGALLLPLPGGVLIGGLASMLYFADIVWFYEGGRPASVAFQIILFTLVAFATGYLGDRLRRAGIALGEVESELRQLRLDTGDILANLSTGVLTVDGTGRLAYLNPAGEALLGLDADQWLGAPALGAVDEVAPGLGMILRRSIDDEIPIDRFRTRTLRNGQEVVLGVSTTVLTRQEGEPPSATALFQDITELERVEALNRRTERLEAVAELSASLAHEIKNPLASIRSAVEQLSGARVRDNDRDVLERLVLNESDRLSRLLTEFLEFSGLQMGNTRSLDLAELVRDCITLVRQHPERVDGVEIHCEGLDAPLLLPVDADLMHRAVFNLVLNAVQFAGPEGEVWVELQAQPGGLPQGLMEGEPAARVTVRDSGPGVPAEDLDRIFDPFFTSRESGSGLGLAVVHRAVQAHRGTVLVKEAPEGGAEFNIFLPAVPAEPAATLAGRGVRT